MYRQKNNQRRAMAEINVVPYIDVMLVLLVIFMVTAPLLSQGVKVDLPKAQAHVLSDVTQEPLIVTVDAQGQYYLNSADHPDVPMTAQALVTRVVAELTLAKQAGQVRSVLVKGDQAARYGRVVQAMVLLQRVGVDHVGLVTESES